MYWAFLRKFSQPHPPHDIPKKDSRTVLFACRLPDLCSLVSKNISRLAKDANICWACTILFLPALLLKPGLRDPGLATMYEHTVEISGDLVDDWSSAELIHARGSNPNVLDTAA